MVTFLFGLFVFIMGIFISAIPIIGWILGPIAFILGFFMMLYGLFGGSRDGNHETEIVYHDFDHPLNEQRQANRKANQQNQNINNNTSSTADELQKLSSMFDKGHLTKEEFEVAKSELLNKK